MFCPITQPHRLISSRRIFPIFFFMGVFVLPATAQDGPWPADVKGFIAPKPGEHPRLLFRKADLPRLRARAKTPEGQAIIKRLKELLGGGEAMPSVKSNITSAYGKKGGPKPAKNEFPVGTYSMSHAAGFGFLYQLTGEKKYAELGKQCFEWAFDGVRDRDREGRYSWHKPGGALRAGPSIGWYALGYDLCYDGWDEAFRTKVAQAIQHYDGADPKDKNTNIDRLAKGARHMPGSNHWGMQVGGAAMALLAIRNDPGTDSKMVEKMLADNAMCMIRNVTEGFGDHGFFAEGDGPGSMSSHIAFLPGVQAWKVAAGKDYISPRPNMRWLSLKYILLTVPRNGKMDFPKRGGYPHNVWARTGISGAGYFSEGFGTVLGNQRSGLLWFYNTHLKAVDEKAGGPYETVSPYPHHAILSFVNWPLDVAPRNPIETIPPAILDKKYHFFACRNRWQDENDIVISCQTKSSRGWIRSNSNGDVVVWGLGKKIKFGRVRNGVSHFQSTADGSVVVQGADGTHLAVDFSKASGAEVVLVMTGPGASGGTALSAGGMKYHVLVLGGSAPDPKADGDRISVGKQTFVLADGKLVMGQMVGPWKAK